MSEELLETFNNNIFEIKNFKVEIINTELLEKFKNYWLRERKKLGAQFGVDAIFPPDPKFIKEPKQEDYNDWLVGEFFSQYTMYNFLFDKNFKITFEEK